ARKQVELVDLLLHYSLRTSADGTRVDISFGADREFRRSRSDSLRRESGTGVRLDQATVTETGLLGFRGRICRDTWKETLGGSFQAQSHHNRGEGIETRPHCKLDHSSVRLGVQS